jgi:hypothetical protein
MPNEFVAIAVACLILLHRRTAPAFVGYVRAAATLIVLVAGGAFCHRHGLWPGGVVVAVVTVSLLLLAAGRATPALPAHIRLLAVLAVAIAAVLVFRQYGLWPGGVAAANAALHLLITLAIAFVIFGIVFNRSNT